MMSHSRPPPHRTVSPAAAEAIALSGRVQHYPWGMKGDSLVGRLGGVSDKSLPCAELWVGSHRSLPSYVGSSTVTLDQILASRADEILGAESVERFGPTLPFLFKILSIGHALSIQSHPDKTLARQLHAQHPEHYPDDNHKPEIAIALTPFQYLYGFQPPAELKQTLAGTPELRQILGASLSGDLARCTPESAPVLLKRACEKIFQTTASELEADWVAMKARIEAIKNPSSWDTATLKIMADFPHDPGIFVARIMNLSTLQPGQAVFLPADVPHAYLSGEIIEVMANSDNVIRAGLTTKYRDIPTLLNSLTFEAKPPSAALESSAATFPGVYCYSAPCEEFAVRVFHDHAHGPIHGAGSVALIFCVEGSATAVVSGRTIHLAPGQSILVPAGSSRGDLRVEQGLAVEVTVPELAGPKLKVRF